jgi:N-succinyldiaminopimelate aminotransferase
MPRHPAVSPTTATLSAGVYSALAEKAKARPGRVFALQVGDTWRDPPECARAEAWRAAEHPRLHAYSPVLGEPVLLEALEARLRTRHGERVPQDGLQVMLGATGGLSVVVDTLVDPGDEVIVLAPFWPLIRGIVAARGATAVQVPFFDRLGAPGFDPEAALASAVTPRTVAIYVNSPNNPTGRILPPDVVDAVARLAKRHDLWVISDEVYEDLAYADPGRPVWTHPELRGRTIANHSFSKSHALAAARVGYTHGPVDVMRAVRGVQTFKTYCAPRPFQYAAARALEEGEAWLAETRALYAAAGRRAAEALGAPAPQAGSFLFFDAAPFFRPGEDLARFLERCLDDAGVLLTPGSAAGAAYGTFVRLCFTVVPPDELDLALAALGAVLRRDAR